MLDEALVLFVNESWQDPAAFRGGADGAKRSFGSGSAWRLACGGISAGSTVDGDIPHEVNMNRWFRPVQVPVAFVGALLVFGAERVLSADTASGGDRSGRSSEGLILLYDFSAASGNTVADRSGVGEAVDLEIQNPRAVRRAAGSLEVVDSTVIRSKKPATKVLDAIRRSGALTLEVWIEPANAQQTGPARILTLSRNSVQRNLTLGQDGDRFDVRLRSLTTSKNGLPSLSAKRRTARSRLTHVVYTRSLRGQARLLVNGRLSAKRPIPGRMSNWDKRFRLALANELDGNRPWLGTYHLVALYSRPLSVGEIQQHFSMGPGAQTPPPTDAVTRRFDPKAKFFETKIAAVLSRHCLECHDPSTRKGRLDLSRKDTAFAGGRDGPPIVPGSSAKSLLWELVASDEMPKNRDPLSDAEKALLRRWIDSGATWSLERIDPAVYAHGGAAGHDVLRRLTVAEYIETVRATLGVDIAEEAHRILPPDLRADGFSNTAYNLRVDLSHVTAYAKLATIIVDRMDVLKFADRFVNRRRFTDADMGKLIAAMGRWVLRGPVAEHEIIAYRGISTTVAAASGSYRSAVELILEAMLQSPRFIYRIEDQSLEADGLPVDDYALASRMSYIIWGGPPDEELLEAAEGGELDATGIQSHIARMLEDPRAVQHSRRFISDWLHLDRLDHLSPNAERFPGWEAGLASDMKAETLAFFDQVVWKEKRPLADLLSADVTFLTPRLARHYGLSAKGAGSGSESERVPYDLSDVPSRGGLLTHGSVLTVGGDDASTVTRGLFVFHELLRGVVKDPPPCVDTTPRPTKPGLTKRAIAMERIENRSCGGCHAKFEPLAFGLEKYDGVGAYHEVDEHGNELRDDGEILFPGEAEPVAFASSAEMMRLLARSDRVRRSLTWKLAQWALGRPLGASSAATVDQIHAAAWKRGGTYVSLITEIVASDLVRLMRTEKDQVEHWTE